MMMGFSFAIVLDNRKSLTLASMTAHLLHESLFRTYVGQNAASQAHLLDAGLIDTPWLDPTTLHTDA